MMMMVVSKSSFCSSAFFLILSLTSLPLAVPVSEEDVDDRGEEQRHAVFDPAIAIRQSALSRGEVEMVDASEVQELRDRANANVSHTLSNTSLADLESDNLTQLLQLRYRERKRQERLLVIQTQILQRLRMNRQPNISANVFSEEEQRRINAIVRRVHQFNNNNHHNNYGSGSENSIENATSGQRAVFEQQFGDDSSTTGSGFRFQTTMQRLQSFYPSCALPNNTEKAIWEQSGAFRIYYELPLSRYTVGPEIIVILAKLRLYKVLPPDPEVWAADLSYLSRYNLVDSLIQNSPTTIVNVYIYQYVKPLRYNRKERKRLVASRSLPIDHEGWVEFNVVPSINYWLRHYGKNFGFDVEVEDAFGNKLDPNLFFRNMNCSSKDSMPQDPPFPNIIDLNPEMMGENDSSLFDNETYPTLDLQTADVTTFDSAGFHLYQPSPFANGEETGKRVVRKRHLHQERWHHASYHGSTGTHHGRNGSECRKETIRASVTDLSLEDVVIYPQVFEWTFCTGSCSLPSGESPGRKKANQHENSPFNKLGGLLRSLMKYTGGKLESRCTAEGFVSLPVLYRKGENELREAVLEDFVPTQCFCRS